MALEVEDGTGKPTAEAYASVAEADARLESLGMNTWEALDPTEKEQALRRAAQYMEQRYRLRWKGVAYSGAQALSWPRGTVISEGFLYPFDAVPTAVKNANIDLALRAAAGDLNPDQGRAVIRQKLGPLEREYDPKSPAGTRYLAIDMMLAPFIRGGQTRVIR